MNFYAGLIIAQLWLSKTLQRIMKHLVYLKSFNYKQFKIYSKCFPYKKNIAKNSMNITAVSGLWYSFFVNVEIKKQSFSCAARKTGQSQNYEMRPFREAYGGSVTKNRKNKK